MDNMKESKNNEKKKITITVISIVVLILIIAGSTYSYFVVNDSNNNLTGNADCYTINYTKGQDIAGDLIQGTDYTSGESTDIIMYSSPSCATMAGTLYITTNDESTMDLTDQALKYTVVVNDEVVSEGSIEGTKNQVIYTGFVLNTVSTTYKVYIWLDSELENDENYLDETYSGFIHADAVISNFVRANAPELTDNLIPVYYDEDASTWKTTSYTNENNKWYDYENKKWANAVLLTETKREEVLDDSNNVISEITIGDTEEDGTLAFYVWIPRYKYKVWNINKEIGTDTYDAQNKGIDIIFEPGTLTTGTVQCEEYDFSVAEGSGLSETCSDTGDHGYYTHPAFTFGDEELTGFWIGKFELSSSSPGSSSTGGAESLVDLTVRVLPGVRSWRHNYIDEFWKVIYDMQTSSNPYALTTSRIKADSHMINNLEWGAVAYLTHSNYGRCTEGVCEEVSINNACQNDDADSNHCFTGRSIGDSQEDYSGTYNYCGSYTYDGYALTYGVVDSKINCTKEEIRDHVSEATKSSTTGNIYGVYDMSGGTLEYVMANLSLQDTDTTDGVTYLYNPNTVSSNSYYSYNGYEKYLTTYAYGTVHNNQNAYNRTRLGDATAEVVLTAPSSWNDDYSVIVVNTLPWAIRGGGYNSANYRNEGIFASNASTGGASTIFGTRSTLIVFDK